MSAKTSDKGKSVSPPASPKPPAEKPGLTVTGDVTISPPVTLLNKAALVEKLQQALNIIGTTYPVAAKPLIQEVMEALKKG